MPKKPSFQPNLKQAKKELKAEEKVTTGKNVLTSISIDSKLMLDVKQVALKRKIQGIKPDTFIGIIRAALVDVVDKEL